MPVHVSSPTPITHTVCTTSARMSTAHVCVRGRRNGADPNLGVPCSKKRERLWWAACCRRRPPAAEEPSRGRRCTPLRRCADRLKPRTRPQRCERTSMPPSRACSGPGTGTTDLLLREARCHRIRPRQPKMTAGSSCERQNGRQGISLEYSDRASPPRTICGVLSPHFWRPCGRLPGRPRPLEKISRAAKREPHQSCTMIRSRAASDLSEGGVAGLAPRVPAWPQETRRGPRSSGYLSSPGSDVDDCTSSTTSTTKIVIQLPDWRQ